MKSQDMQVIGLCRFSYPAYGGFQVGHETLEETPAPTSMRLKGLKRGSDPLRL